MKWYIGVLWIVAIGIVAPWLFSNGFLFFLDYVSTPTLPPIQINNTGLASGISVQLLSHILAAIVPSHAVAKILLLLILGTAGTSMASLARYTIGSRIPYSTASIVAFSCGLLYMLNPFVYNRIAM